MQRVANGTQNPTRPALVAEIGTPGFFADQNDGAAVATIIDPDWLNNFQEEIVSVIAAADITLDATDVTQLLQAIQTLIAAAASPFLIDTGAANAYVLTPATPIGGYAVGQSFTFKAANANTGASTMNISAEGAIPIVHRDGQPLQAGDIPAGAVCRITTADAAHFQLESMIPTAATTALLGLAQLATNAQAAAMAATNVVLTPSNLAGLFSQSLANPGWYKLPGGLILQWLTVGVSISTEGEQTFALPISFPNAQLAAVGNALNTHDSALEDIWLQATGDGDQAHVVVYCQGTSSSPGAIQGVVVFVLGF